MTKHFEKPFDVDRIEPLLRAIGREIGERAQAVRELEQRMSAFSKTPRIHAREIAAIESELSAHRRELRRVQSELAHLGVEFDPQMPWIAPRILQAKLTSKAQTDDTSFFDPADRQRA